MQKFFYKELDSTNLNADKLLENKDLKSPVWIRTDNQFAGKGQGKHTWISEPGKNLTGSLVLFPDKMDASDQFDLSILCSLSACDFLKIFIEDVRIKWPNDLYAGDKKIGGILIESAILGQFVKHAILGIGININQVVFPVHIPNPVSLTNLTGIRYNLVELEDILLEALKNRFRGHLSKGINDELNHPDPGQFRSEYLGKLFRFNEFAPYKASGVWFRARIINVNQFGHLILEDEEGTMRPYAFQEVEYIH